MKPQSWHEHEEHRARQAEEDRRDETFGELRGIAWFSQLSTSDPTEAEKRQRRIRKLRYDVEANQEALDHQVLSEPVTDHIMVQRCKKCDDPALECYLDDGICAECRLKRLEAIADAN